MSRVFTLRTVLRQVPNRLLREVLARLGVPAHALAWDDLRERDVEPVVDALSTLPPGPYDAVEGTLHLIYDLACATGIAAVRETREALGGDAGDLPDEASVYEQAAWAWLHWPEVAEQALLLHQVDRLSWWRRRTDLPRVPPSTSAETLARLGRDFSAILGRAEGRGRKCTVEAFTRRGTTCYFAFPDDFVLNVTAHDEDGRLAPRTFRRTFTMVFAVDPAEGALELYAKVAAGLKPQIERAFASAVYGVDLDDWRPPPSYEPDVLRTPGFKLETDPEDAVDVDVRQLRLSLANSDRQIVLRGEPAWPGDVFKMLDDVLDKEALPPGSYRITLATFTFEFRSVGGRRGGSVTFDVAFPYSCGLRNQRPDRVAVIIKYLTRWGIHVGGPAGPGLAAAG